ncbi:MAG: GGDEF domain-containing protein [Oscillospiraceae bacterium]|nr:GGDEF domain-containing protein [Oscillospiraceae bacterium]
MKSDENKAAKRGVSANSVMLPIIAVLALLMFIIIALMLNISATGLELSRYMQRSALYREDATSLLGGASLMSETSTNFILMPISESGTLNIQPLIAYTDELGVPRRGDDIMARFREYDVSEDERAMLSTAAQCANNMMDAQLHALSLVCSVYPLPSRPPFESLPLRELSEEEKRLGDEEKLAAAKLLVLNADYVHDKQSVSQNVSICVTRLKEDAEQNLAATTARFRTLGILLMTAMVLAIGMLFFNFVVLYRQLLTPLRADVRLIETDEALNDGKGLLEVRLLAEAYNRLLKRRESLEGILRSAAHTDRLTGLPNRYGYEQYMLDAGYGGFSLGVYLFDINYLKQTNDTLGHAAGDKLIQTSARCICECFGQEGEGNCFRFGGDEFAAVVRGCAPDRLEQMERRFEELQKEHGISVSWGRAYTEELGETTLKALLGEADREMYRRKEQMHREAGKQ